MFTVNDINPKFVYNKSTIKDRTVYWIQKTMATFVYKLVIYWSNFTECIFYTFSTEHCIYWLAHTCNNHFQKRQILDAKDNLGRFDKSSILKNEGFVRNGGQRIRLLNDLAIEEYLWCFRDIGTFETREVILSWIISWFPSHGYCSLYVPWGTLRQRYGSLRMGCVSSVQDCGLSESRKGITKRGASQKGIGCWKTIYWVPGFGYNKSKKIQQVQQGKHIQIDKITPVIRKLHIKLQRLTRTGTFLNEHQSGLVRRWRNWNCHPFPEKCTLV